jgi:putative ABC transport system permease protein
LIGAGLLIKSFRRLLDVDPGFNPDNVATMQLAAPASGAETATFYDQLLERVKALPQTDSASLTTALPLTGATYGGPFSIEGKPLDMSGPPPHVYFRTTGPGYFHVMGIPIMKGRDFNGDDTDRSEPVVIVNEALARGFFSEGDAIGKRIKLGAPQNPRPWMTIAGVVKDVRSDGLDTAVTPEMYVPYSQTTGPNSTGGAMTLVVRTNIDSAGSIPAIRREVQAFAKDQPIYNITTMKQLLRQSVAQRRFRMLMLIVFAAVALLLAASGVFGVMGYTVAQRTREIGIRMSLGAQRRDILKMVGQDGLILTSIGVALGLSAALVLTRAISSLLFGVGPLDPPTFTLVSALMAFVSLLACYIPARRATRVDPLVALRYE